MMRFKEFLEATGRDKGEIIQESIIGGPIQSQLASARVSYKANNERLQKALKAHQTQRTTDNLALEVARLRADNEALLASSISTSRELHLCVELLAALYEERPQARGR